MKYDQSRAEATVTILLRKGRFGKRGPSPQKVDWDRRRELARGLRTAAACWMGYAHRESPPRAA